MAEETSARPCACCGTEVAVLACSGVSNLGHLADLAARELSHRGSARMGCLAGIGAGAAGSISAVRNARRVLVIDGCPTQCGRRTLERAGLTEFVSIRVDQLGFKRGESPVTQENVQRIADEVCRILSAGRPAEGEADSACCQ
ncbi:MAG: putative zinc-binding protein [Clostridia bacterium]|uniref:putative zinc-binding protein n=1 Tax=Thermogutta sp. TaxID=1962930 RepID=UPI0019BDB12A|nr:putative zinc-binding protein [Thermogutta sp.]MBC7335443.1 putative zinc-binding protein [Clostridia bacterium]MBC7352103.1 putative zinc-binding protein [Thermogutta sp.]